MKLMGKCVFLLVLTVGMSGYGRAMYTPPNMSARVFSISRISISAADRKKLATELAGFVRRGNAMDQKHLFFAARALGIALRLDPENRSAVVTGMMLNKGETPTPVKTEWNYKKLAANLMRRVVYLKKQGGRDNTVLAGYLLSLAVDIDPRNEDAAFEYGKRLNSGQKVDWHPIVGEQKLPPKPKPAPSAATVRKNAAVPNAGSASAGIGPVNPEYANKVRGFVRNQASIKGLLVLTTAAGMHVGTACDIIMTVQRNNLPNRITWTFARPVGKQMIISRDEALRAVQVRYPYLAGGYTVTTSFGDKYTAKDGGSAGTAFSLLFLSLLDNIQLDPAFAVTGDITVDWKVRRVGGIPAKVRGATLDKCAYVAIPTGNLKQLEEMMLLFPSRSIWEIQVFGIDTLQSAVALVRTDRSENIQKAMDLFARIQQFLKKKPSAYRKNKKIRQALQQVCRWAPNHLSARCLLLKANHKLPRHLSPRTSVEQILLGSRNVLGIIAGVQRYRAGAGVVTEEGLQRSVARMEKLARIVAPDTVPLCRELHDYMISLKELEEQARRAKRGTHTELSARLLKTKLDKAAQDANSAHKRILELLQRLSNDRTLLNDMLR